MECASHRTALKGGAALWYKHAQKYVISCGGRIKF